VGVQEKMIEPYLTIGAAIFAILCIKFPEEIDKFTAIEFINGLVIMLIAWPGIVALAIFMRFKE
jgi:hypothetical protein